MLYCRIMFFDIHKKTVGFLDTKIGGTMYKAILFDLDGTLTESGEGITKCVQYALEKLGKP